MKTTEEKIMDLLNAISDLIEEEERKAVSVEDDKFYFGDKFTIDTSSEPVYIGKSFAQRGDACKVLLCDPGWEWVLLEDYFEGRNAVCLKRV